MCGNLRFATLLRVLLVKSSTQGERFVGASGEGFVGLEPVPFCVHGY